MVRQECPMETYRETPSVSSVFRNQASSDFDAQTEGEAREMKREEELPRMFRGPPASGWTGEASERVVLALAETSEDLKRCVKPEDCTVCPHKR